MENISLHDKIISGVCRLCLSGDGALIDMFSFSSELENQIADAVTKCTSVKVEKHIKLPTNICESCYTQLIKTQNFQRHALQSDATLQLYLKQLEDDDMQTNIPGSSVTLPGISGNHFIETNITELDNKDNSTNCEEIIIKPEVKYFENGYDEFEMNIVEKKVDPLETGLHTKWSDHRSDKDSVFNPNLIVKSEPIITDSDQFGIDTNVLNDFVPSQKVIKSENEISNDQFVASDQCDVSNESFSCSSNLKKQKKSHTAEKPYQCDACNKCFISAAHLRRHQLVHTGEKPYQCVDCLKRFKELNSYRRHQSTHVDEKRYHCEVCKKSFKFSYTLKTHERIHTGDKPYQCDVCHKCFSESGSLKIHQRIHTGEKPYKCDVCNKCFTTKSDLGRHKRLHTGEKPYKCDVCNKCFGDIGHLRRHQRSHTVEKP